MKKLLFLTFVFILTACSNAAEDSSLRAPGSPINLQYSQSKDVLTITWDKVPDASDYKLYWTTNSDLPLAERNVVLNVTLPYSHVLTNELILYFQVTALNSVGESPPSEPLVVLFPPTISATPQKNATLINWASVDKVSYDLYWSDSGTILTQGGDPLRNVTPPVTVDNLANGTTYYFTVVARMEGAQNAVSNLQSATPLNGLPYFVTQAPIPLPENTENVVIEADDDEQDALLFSLNGTGQDLFTIDAQTGLLSFQKAPNFEAPHDSGLDNIYEVEITLTENNPQSDTNLSVEQLFTIEVSDVEAPAVAITPLQGGANLQWPAVPNATSYNIYYALDQRISPSNFQSLENATAQLNVASNTDITLPSYFDPSYVIVEARDDSGVLDWSEPAQVSPLPQFELGSIATDGTNGDSGSSLPRLSGDGRYVVFQSRAKSLANKDSFGFDIYLHDRFAKTTIRVSENGGTGGDGESYNPDISASGRHIVFDSFSENLTTDDGNGFRDIFLYDSNDGSLVRISKLSDPQQTSNGDSSKPVISNDGCRIAFVSSASNLVAGDDNNAVDVFYYDCITKALAIASKSTGNVQAQLSSTEAAISGDGNIIAFISGSDNLVAGDDNNLTDVFVHDIDNNQTSRVSVTSEGQQVYNGASWNPRLSYDGNIVVFRSPSPSFTANDNGIADDIYMHNRTTGETLRISNTPEGGEPDGDSSEPVVSADGRFILFTSHATNLVIADKNATSDIFMFDQNNNRLTRVSVDANNIGGGSGSGGPHISADGRYIAFHSWAPNFVQGKSSLFQDVFIAPGPYIAP